MKYPTPGGASAVSHLTMPLLASERDDVIAQCAYVDQITVEGHTAVDHIAAHGLQGFLSIGYSYFHSTLPLLASSAITWSIGVVTNIQLPLTTGAAS